jgi:hypothetical protein
MIYRNTEPEFNDIQVVTDSHGEPKFWKPIAQFDLADSIIGPDPIGINGAHFFRGDDTGLQHSYVDNDVVNGQRYYYAVVSYDMGDPEFGTKGLVPSECTKIITEDLTGVLKFVDINCAVIVPNAPAAGYIPPEITGDLDNVAAGIGTGSINVAILDEGEIIDGAQYNVEFDSEGSIPDYNTSSFRVIKTFGSEIDTIISHVSADELGTDKFSQPFDGMALSVTNDTAISVDQNNTDWLIGESNLTMNVIPDQTSPAVSLAWPSDYEIKFFEDIVYTTPNFNVPVNFIMLNTTTGDTSDAEVWDNDGSGGLSIGDEIVIIEYIESNFKLTWRIEYFAPGIPNVQPLEPEPGDIFVINTKKQFMEGDYFSYVTNAASVDNEMAKNSLSKIKVVPNPYIAAASWERRNLNQTGRGERKIDFINLPAECKIRIYTVTGALVKTLEKNSSPTDGTISWNLVSEDGMDIAYGLYVYHVDAPGIGEYIGKFAIIK